MKIKLLILLGFLFVVICVNAQKRFVMDTVRLSNPPDLSYYKGGQVDVAVLILKDGSALRKGDLLKFGNISDVNNVLKIQGNNRTYFTFVFWDKFTVMNNLSPDPFHSSNKLEDILVDRIIFYETDLGDIVIIQFVEKNGKKVGYIKDLDKAVKRGEIINPNRMLTRDEAIQKIREAKDLFELNIISQDEFDKIQATLKPVIMKN